MVNNKSYLAKSAEELLNEGLSLMKMTKFGDAVNTLRAASEHPSADEAIRSKALAAIDVIGEINGFVNVDLMNP